MRKTLTILLAVIAVTCIGLAVAYPIRYTLQQQTNESTIEDLRALRNASGPTSAPSAPAETPSPEPADAPVATAEAAPSASPDAAPATASPDTTAMPDTTAEPDATVLPGTTVEPGATVLPGTTVAPAAVDPDPAEAPATVEPWATVLPGTTVAPWATLAPKAAPATALPSEAPTASPSPTPDPTRAPYTGALAYPNKEKVVLEPDKILPMYRDIYALNHDLVGWLVIEGIEVDHPVMQNADDSYYLHHDFNGSDNNNGQLFVFNICDVFTPSYNIVISGHNMRSGKMFGHLVNYAKESFWQEHMTFTFDTIMREGTYVVIAAFYSADYDEDEDGFRYLANIQYPRDYREWIEDVQENALYDTAIDTRFGDEFLTLTTCAYQRKNGRFVVIARRVRDGEIIAQDVDGEE